MGSTGNSYDKPKPWVSDNMRILLTARSGQFAGVERRILSEAEYLGGTGHQPTVAINRFHGEQRLKEACNNLGVSYQRLVLPPFLSDWRRRYRHYGTFRLSQFRWRWLTGYELVHVFMPWTNCGLEQMALARRLGIPYVVSAHNTFGDVDKRPDWHRRFLTDAFRNCVGYYAVSDDALMQFERAFEPYLPEDAIRATIHNFVDTSLFKPSRTSRRELRNALGVPAETRIVGNVGRIAGHKRPFLTLRVFECLAQWHPDVHFLFMGEGPLRNELLAKIQESHARSRIHLLPFSDSPEKVMGGLDVHVLMSWVEGFGIVTAEAMASGVPVVATAASGTREVIDNGVDGYLVPVDDWHAAAERVDAVLRDASEADRLCKAGRQKAEQSFSADVWRRNVGHFYAAVAARVPAATAGNLER